MRAGRAELWLVLHDRAPRRAVNARQRFAGIFVVSTPTSGSRRGAVLLAMREIKSPAELTLIQRAIDITAEAQKAAMTRVLTATREYEVQATVEFTFRSLVRWRRQSSPRPHSTTPALRDNNDPIVRDGLLLTDSARKWPATPPTSREPTRPAPRSPAEQRAIYEVSSPRRTSRWR